MRRRLYYLLPDSGSARKIMDDLLLARIEDGDKLLLCTDGLWNLLDGTDELGQLVESSGECSPLALARRLVSTALSRGGHDNVTVAVIDVAPEEG